MIELQHGELIPADISVIENHIGKIQDEIEVRQKIIASLRGEIERIRGKE